MTVSTNFLTSPGREEAVLFTKTYCRVLTPGLAALDVDLSTDLAQRSPSQLLGDGSTVAWTNSWRDSCVQLELSLLDRFVNLELT